MKTRLLLFTGQVLDVATFWLLFMIVPVALMSEVERNPTILALFSLGGFAAVAVVKIGVTSLVCYRDTVRVNRPKVTAIFMALAAGSGFVGAFSNTVALVTVVSIMKG